ncbi:TPA: hypothetical protein ACQ6JW_003320 [Klebsiella pneumoniae]|uniref:hypothetical protein n=1 Tax=Enterobacteriaceae TaxID=543 RepID=UPI000808E332|nr:MULTISPECIES: hypothetical protein [Enterobacteriaceae]EET4561684.1 hypothetical protein [Escherichia coli]EEV1272099.1 hypothetical protein [Escherichia coli]EEV3828395.1 hypothetical protein [Escherichia coli]EEW8714515.1 hypothetical protein [Escherichia coli]EEX9390776.1 hypothetical protein [Escherichia coli]
MSDSTINSYGGILRFGAGFSIVLMTLTAIFIWFYLTWIGRLDIFLQAVTFNELFSFSGIIFLSSIILFCGVLFLPCLLGCLVIHGNQNNAKSKRKKVLQAFIYAGSSFLCITFVALISLFDIDPGEFTFIALMLLTGIISVFITFILQRKSIRSHLKSLNTITKIKILLLDYSMKPFLLGINCWLVVFPITLLSKFLHVESGMDDYQQTSLFLVYGTLVIVINIFPLIFFLRQDFSRGWFKPLRNTTGVVFALLLLSSAFMHVIPLLIVNMAFRMTGMTIMEPVTISIKTDEIPSEMLHSRGWKYQLSEDKKFSLVSGVIFFSYGGVYLVCPKETTKKFRESIIFDILSEEIEKKAREEIKKSAQQCIAVDKSALNF